MKISEVKDAAKLAFESQVTLCLVGESGIAKTSIWKSIYKDLGFDKYLIIRPALFADSADLVGLPDFIVIDGQKRTSFLSPDWLPLDNQKVLIIVDEINRIDKQVANAIFGMIEAEGPTVGQYKLPTGCKVVATCNPPKKNYSGVLNIADSAWSSRLSFVKILPTLEDYSTYGRKSGEVSDGMLSFLAENPKFFGNGDTFEVDEFFGTSEAERSSHIVNNLRSKTKISKIYEKGQELNSTRSVVSELIRGIAGLEFTSSFIKYMENFNTNISLAQILKDTSFSDKFDFAQISNVAKVKDDFCHYLETDKLKVKDIPNFVYFLSKCPNDIVFGFSLWLGNNSGLKNVDKLMEEMTLNVEMSSKYQSIKG